MTAEDENADLELHERIVFCHILDLRENLEKKKHNEDTSKDESLSETFSIKDTKERIQNPTRKVGRPPGSVKVPPKIKQIRKSPKFNQDSGEKFRKNLNYLERNELSGFKPPNITLT